MITGSGSDTTPILNPLAEPFFSAEPTPAAGVNESSEHVAVSQAEVDEWGKERHPG